MLIIFEPMKSNKIYYLAFAFIFASKSYSVGFYDSFHLKFDASSVSVEDKNSFIGEIVNQVDEYGDTALICASSKGHSEVVKLLLKHSKTDVNQKNKDGYTALICASNTNRLEVVKLLLKHPKININQKNKDGYTALICAAKEDYSDVFKLIECAQKRAAEEEAAYEKKKKICVFSLIIVPWVIAIYLLCTSSAKKLTEAHLEPV
jgi:ankyrin repeat protein